MSTVLLNRLSLEDYYIVTMGIQIQCPSHSIVTMGIQIRCPSHSRSIVTMGIRIQ